MPDPDTRTFPEAEVLADAVRTFLAVPVIAQAVAAGPAWSAEWIGAGLGGRDIRIGDVVPLASALARFDEAVATGAGEASNDG